MKNIWIFFMLLFASCQTVDWKTNKSESDIYPIEKIELVKTKEFVNLVGSQFIWKNISLEKYPYKEFCPNKVFVSFNLEDSSMLRLIKDDSLCIAFLLSKKFKENGVSHFAFQSIGKNVLNICLYTEDNLNPIGILRDFEIPSEALLQTEIDWTTYTNYMQMK